MTERKPIDIDINRLDFWFGVKVGMQMGQSVAARHRASSLPAVDVNALVKQACLNKSAIARQCGVSTAHLHCVVTGRTRSRRVAETIAALLGIPVKKLWPGVYRDKAA